MNPPSAHASPFSGFVGSEKLRERESCRPLLLLLSLEKFFPQRPLTTAHRETPMLALYIKLRSSRPKSATIFTPPPLPRARRFARNWPRSTSSCSPTPSPRHGLTQKNHDSRHRSSGTSIGGGQLQEVPPFQLRRRLSVSQREGATDPARSGTRLSTIGGGLPQGRRDVPFQVS